MIAKWLIIGFIALGALLTVTLVGKPRKPLTPGAAALTVLVCAVEIVAICIWWR